MTILLRVAALLLGNMLMAGTLMGETLQLAAPFCDGLVLQQMKPVPIWGTAGANEHIRVQFAGQDVQAIADHTGNWCAELEPMSASAMPRSLVVTGGNVVTVRDVLVGEVWLCSGQSNMEWPLRQINSAANEIGSANFPQIRQFNLQAGVADSPMKMAKGRWIKCSPETAGGFMATGYFFARELHQKLGVLVGLVKAAVGGSPIEAWLGQSVGVPVSLRASALARWKAMHDVPPERLAHSKPGALYNGLVSPLEPLGLAGALWYQGEANAVRADEYQGWLSALIDQWRDNFQQGELPFLIVQLPQFQPKEETRPQSWAWLRDAQAAVAASKRNVHMAVTLDVGETDNIHPHNKQAVGYRLALLALAKCYGKPVEYSGPVFEEFKPEGAGLRLQFSHAKGLCILGGDGSCFELAGQDRNFVRASARIVGETVLISADSVPKPVAVRYVWRNVSEAYLFNADGLPAAPFRTDNW